MGDISFEGNANRNAKTLMEYSMPATAYHISGQSYGETLMKSMLDRLVPKKYKHQNNIRPSWLENPGTGAYLELDRYYVYAKPKKERRAAFEFQGDQHYTSKKQRARDKLKAKLCRKHRVKLVYVTARDLTWAVMSGKVMYACGYSRKCSDKRIECLTKKYRKCLKAKGLKTAYTKGAKLEKRGAWNR